MGTGRKPYDTEEFTKEVVKLAVEQGCHVSYTTPM